jgi:hypothetical protein
LRLKRCVKHGFEPFQDFGDIGTGFPRGQFLKRANPTLAKTALIGIAQAGFYVVLDQSPRIPIDRGQRSNRSRTAFQLIADSVPMIADSGG